MRSAQVPTPFGIAALALLLLRASAPGAVAAPAARPAGDALTYDAALQRALSASPRIAAARLHHAIGVAARDVAAERPNPELRVELEKETPKEGYSLAWPWELGGKRARRVAVADAAIASGDAELAQVAAEVRSEVRRAFAARVVAERSLVLVAELRGIAGRARDAARARFEAGGAPRLDVLQAELVLADAENQEAAARGAADAARVALNALLGFPLDAPTAIVGSDADRQPIAVDAAVARARAEHVELVLLDRRLAEARARRALAAAMRTPDLTPEVTLTRRAAPEFDTGWRVALGVTLPLLSTHAAGVRLEDATVAQLTAERAAVETRVAGEVAAAATLAETSRQQAIRYRDDILPRATEVERMADDAYRLGQTGIAAYLQALQASRDVRLRAIRASADFEAALSDLERAIGAPAVPLP